MCHSAKVLVIINIPWLKIHLFSIKCNLFPGCLSFLIFIMHFCRLTFKWPGQNGVAGDGEELNCLKLIF